MRRKRYIVGATMIGCVLLSLSVWLGVASASTSISFIMSEHGPYSCLGPCATATDFTVSGIVHSNELGTMTDSGIGHVDGPPDAQNCIPQSENWAFTSQGRKGQDSFTITTIGDKLCFNADFTVGIENADFTITGGTGRFTGASGSGHFTFTVLGHPQKGSGTITGTLNLP